MYSGTLIPRVMSFVEPPRLTHSIIWAQPVVNMSITVLPCLVSGPNKIVYVEYEVCKSLYLILANRQTYTHRPHGIALKVVFRFSEVAFRFVAKLPHKRHAKGWLATCLRRIPYFQVVSLSMFVMDAACCKYSKQQPIHLYHLRGGLWYRN